LLRHLAEQSTAIQYKRIAHYVKLRRLRPQTFKLLHGPTTCKAYIQAPMVASNT